MPTNKISKVKLNNNSHEVIPHRLTDGTNIVSIPTISVDCYMVTSGNPIVLDDMPTETDSYELWASVDGAIVTYRYICIN